LNILHFFVKFSQVANREDKFIMARNAKTEFKTEFKLRESQFCRYLFYLKIR